MGLGVVIIFYLFCSAVLFGTAAGFCLVAWMLLRTRWPKLRALLIATPFVVGGAPTALLAVDLLWSSLAPPSALFEQVFEVRPSGRIHDLQASASRTSDAEEVFLAFKTDAANEVFLVAPPFEKIQGSTEEQDLVPMPAEAPPARTYVQARWID